MALGEIKEKLKEKLHLSKHQESNSTPESTSHAPNRSSVASSVPTRDRLSHDRNARCTFASGASIESENLLTNRSNRKNITHTSRGCHTYQQGLFEQAKLCFCRFLER
jgi:hypothetical protein